ncbi:anthranilate synthase component II [Companilactobacillus furfuricola]|uniref:anthranilate synthase component II n=1 Tax=Companilactobacillus furfuricola TaxID=1462575 RepID=UPI000F7A62D5|nr:aminodeoxychorismate/anthranilate synthase component II [Companilactobacillus furfuricola]
MIYLIDNYDSFTYNLYQLLGTISDTPITVVKNDQFSTEQLEKLAPDALVFSPGPGRPENAGNMNQLLKDFIGKVPILGVCLGEQAIGEIYGANVIHAPKLMHGKPSKITITQPGQLFQDCPQQFSAARYHSLIVDKNSIPKDLTFTAMTAEGEIMAVADEKKKVFGVQFHPESIMTDLTVGKQIAKNFLQMV